MAWRAQLMEDGHSPGQINEARVALYGALRAAQRAGYLPTTGRLSPCGPAPGRVTAGTHGDPV